MGRQLKEIRLSSDLILDVKERLQRMSHKHLERKSRIRQLCFFPLTKILTGFWLWLLHPRVWTLTARPGSLQQLKVLEEKEVARKIVPNSLYLMLQNLRESLKRQRNSRLSFLL